MQIWRVKSAWFPLFTDNIQHTVATERVRRGEKNSAWLYEELLRVWSVPDKGMKVLQLPSAVKD